MKLAIPPLVQVAIALVAMWAIHVARLPLRVQFPLQDWLAVIVGLIGLAVIILAGGLFRSAGTTVDPRSPEKGEALVTTGIYRVTRNPMYVGMALILLAAVIASGQPLNLLILAIFIWFMTRFQIVPEEEFLLGRYGAQYDDFRQQVPRWLWRW